MANDERPGGDIKKTRFDDDTLSDVAFDRWFRHQVHRIYDETMAEPLPDDLVALLERFPSRDATEPGKTKDDEEDGAERG